MMRMGVVIYVRFLMSTKLLISKLMGNAAVLLKLDLLTRYPQLVA